MSRPCAACAHHAQAHVDRFVCLAPSPARLIPLEQFQARDAHCHEWRRDRFQTEQKTDKDRAPHQPIP
ncbi:hypothetical protein IP95_01613 [Extensimonas vulgaris]|uniref:Uncharacterized protein n=1 Tax=Extensimonas vulgaris TaxID=1031594 RepID=A0A369AS45_9BURK|nr:hypothetical protein DFR45_101375 [Extensimonas vulgaris]TWI39066.1 hypothetical protein IP95_01613 [Extensimonas vulgaris]